MAESESVKQIPHSRIAKHFSSRKIKPTEIILEEKSDQEFEMFIRFQKGNFIFLDHNIIPLSHKYLLSAFHLPGTVLSPRDKGVEKMGKHGYTFMEFRYMD